MAGDYLAEQKAVVDLRLEGPLVGNLAGFWSRRIDDTHRLVYEADEVSVLIVACCFHYDD